VIESPALSLDMNVLQNTPAAIELANLRGTQYLADANLSVSFIRDVWGSRLYLTDLTNAFLAGKVCEHILFIAESSTPDRDCVGLNTILDLIASHGGDLRKVFEAGLAREWPLSRWGGWENLNLGNLVVARTSKQAIRVYSPFTKPAALKSMPKKWTVSMAVRALLNGQFSSCKCTGVYSDDYAHDAAVNFHKGGLNAVVLAARIVESPSGWWATESEGVVSISCHHFDNNEFVPALQGKAMAAA